MAPIGQKSHEPRNSAAPARAFHLYALSSKGFRPWLSTPAPSGAQRCVSPPHPIHVPAVPLPRSLGVPHQSPGSRGFASAPWESRTSNKVYPERVAHSSKPGAMSISLRGQWGARMLNGVTPVFSALTGSPAGPAPHVPRRQIATCPEHRAFLEGRELPAWRFAPGLRRFARPGFAREKTVAL